MVTRKQPILSIDDEASQLIREFVQPAVGDFNLLLANVKTGADNLDEAKPRLQSLLKQWDGAQVTRYRALAAAFRKAAFNVTYNEKGENKALTAATREAWALRRVLMAAARLGVMQKRLDAKTVSAISKGGGIIDCANDLSELARMLRDKAKGGPQWGVTRENLGRAEELSGFIVRTAKPSKRKRLADPTLKAARLTRDRYYTLLRGAYKELAPFAALAFGIDDLADRFPPLLARRSTRKSREETP